jgi:hypothetical protein
LHVFYSSSQAAKAGQSHCCGPVACEIYNLALYTKEFSISDVNNSDRSGFSSKLDLELIFRD